MDTLTPEVGTRVLERLLRSAATQVGVVPMDVRAWTESFPAAAKSSRASRLLGELRGVNGAQQGGDAVFLEALREAATSQRPRLIEDYALGQAARVLRVGPERISRERPLTDLGLDSVMGLELRNRLAVALSVTIPPTILWTYPTLHALSGYLVERLFPAPAPVNTAAAVAAASAASAAPRPARNDEAGWQVRETANALSHLSDAEKDQLLAARIADLERMLEGDG